MLDVGWSEIFLIMAVTVLVMGPEEIPKIMMTFGRIVRRLNYVRFAMTQQFEAMMKEAGIDPNELNMNVNFEAGRYERHDFDEAAADEDIVSVTEDTGVAQKTTKTHEISAHSAVKK